MLFYSQRRYQQNILHAVDFNRVLSGHADGKFAVGIWHQGAGIVVNCIGSRVRAAGVAAQRHGGQAGVDAVQFRFNRRVRFGQNGERNILTGFDFRDVAFGNLHFV